MTARKQRLKVYGWTASPAIPADHPFASDPTRKPWHGQVRAIVAATSQKKAAEIAGYATPRQMWNLTETGNDQELEVALAEPGVVFIAPDQGGRPTYYRFDRRPV
jgi:hypothetical protein